MKKIFFLIAFICLEAQAQIPSTLGWYEVPNTKIRPVCYGGAANTQCQNVVAAWSSGAMDTMRNRMIIWGGGHNDYYGNEMYAVNFSGTVGAVRLTDPTAGGCSLYSCDGGITPNSRHTYDGIEYMPNVDKLFVYGGAPAGAGFPQLNDTWTFDFPTKTWAYKTPTLGNGGVQPSNWFVTTAYDPVTGKVFITDYQHIYSYDPLTNSYTSRGDMGNLNGYWSTGAIDPVRHKYLLIGGSDCKIFDISGNGSYNATSCAAMTGGAAVIAAGYPGIIYDAASDRMLAWFGTDTVYSLNMDTMAWTGIIMYTGGPGAEQTSGTYNRWNYSPALGSVVLINSVDQNAYTFRTMGGTPPPPVDTVPPSVPTILTGVAISASQINLTWVASTDNIGVTGYRLDRCTGAACSNFTEIAQPATPAYSNAGLAEFTSYSYRVRSMDAAGNTSGYSAVASTSTPAAPTPIPPSSSTLTVGPGKMYATVCAAIAAAQTGNIIEVDAAVYHDESCAVTKALTLKGIGGYAHMQWGSGDYAMNTNLIPNGKGALIIQATTSIDHFEFSGAKVVDENGAGIRYEAGDLTITNSYFHGNQNGLLGQGGLSNTLLIEHSSFDRNGFCGGGGCGHNLYVGLMGRFIFHDNVSTNSLDGSHTLKSRAQVNEITDSFLSTRDSDGSLEADFPNGGTVYFTGNTVEQGANTNNSTMLGYGLEGATNPNKKLILSLNKFINRRTNGATFIQVNGSPSVDYKTNTFIGPGTVPSNLDRSNTVAP